MKQWLTRLLTGFLAGSTWGPMDWPPPSESESALAANVTARVIRVSDSRILAVEEASAFEAADRDTLKKAGKDIRRKLAHSAGALTKP